MSLISEVDKSGSDIEEYVTNLDHMLIKKMQMIIGVRKKLADFTAHLKMEKMLQAIYQKKQAEIETGGSMDSGHIYDRSDGSNDFLQQDSDGMIMGVGPGNSNITQNFIQKTNHAKNGQNLLGGLTGDRADEDNMDDGDENIGE